MILDLPATLAVDILTIPAHHLVADDVKMAAWLVAQEFLEQGTDDGSHTRRENDYGNVVIPGPVIELGEEGVQLHVLLQCLDTLVVRGVDALEHFAKGVPGLEGSLVRLRLCAPMVHHSHRKPSVSSRTWSFNLRRRSRPKPRLSICDGQSGRTAKNMRQDTNHEVIACASVSDQF